MNKLRAFIAGGGAHLCRVLMKARQQAKRSGTDLWQSAVDVSELVHGGASVTAVGYLLAEGYAQTRIETTKPGAALRTFVDGGRAFAPASCIVLTAAGAAFVTGLLYGRLKKTKRRTDSGHPDGVGLGRGSKRPKPGQRRVKRSRRTPAAPRPGAAAEGPSEKGRDAGAAETPDWNEAKGDLYWREELILHLAAQASAERAIVRGLAALGLPATIANPLSGPGAAHARRNAVRELKKRQHPLRIEFQSLRGNRIRWFEVE